MSRLFFIVLFLCSVVMVNAQPNIEWQKCLGGQVDDYGLHGIQTADGGYIVTGAAYSNDGDITGNNGDTDFWTAKLNATGVIQWEKNFGGSGTEQANRMRQTSDGGFVMAGAASSADGDISAPIGNFDYWIVKLDNAGNFLWEKSYGGTMSDQANDIIETSDGGLLIAGFSYSGDGDVSVNQGAEDVWIVKTDAAGTIQWEKSYGGSASDVANSVVQTADGGYIIAGYSNSNDGDISAPKGDYDYWVVKTDAAGVLQWEKSLGGTSDDWGNAIVEAFDGGFIVTGSSPSDDGDVTGAHGNYDTWTVKLTDPGVLSWETNLGGAGDDRSYGITATTDNGCVFTGISDMADGDVTGIQGSYDIWTAKLDAAGSIEWQRSLGGPDMDYCGSVVQAADGGFLLTGYTYSDNGDVSGLHGPWGASDYWVVKLETLNDNVTWTGAIDSDWNTPGNWSGFAVPLATEDAIIPDVANDPEVNNDVACANLTLRPAAGLTVNAGNTLTVNGNVKIESDATGMADLIDIGALSVTGGALVSLYLPDSSSHYVSSPVSNGLADVFMYAELSRYDEALHFWPGMVPGDNLDVMKGYRELYTDSLAHTVIFTSILNTGPLNFAVDYTDTGVPADDGWNLAGNPYPSHADWDAGIGWTKTNIDNTIYYWSVTQYATYNGTTGVGVNGGTQFIPAMQGFFVKCNNVAGGTLGMTNDVRVISNQPFYKSGISDILRISVEGNGYSDEAAIHFYPGADSAFESDYDAYKLYGIPAAPQIYTFLSPDSVFMSINTLGELTGTTTVPVGFKAGKSGNYIFRAEQMSSFADSVFVFLYDILTDLLVDLRTDSVYQFSATAGTDNERFRVLFSFCDDISVAITPENPQICSGDSVVLSAVVSGGITPYSYLWNTGCTVEACLVSTAGTICITITDSNGCAASDSSDITILETFVTLSEIEVCYGDSLFLQNTWQTASGIYYDTLESANGCDSIITTQLIVNPVYGTTVSTAICNGDSIYLGSTWQALSGNYFDTLSSTAGCDSIIETELTVNQLPDVFAGIDTSICDGDSIIITASVSGGSIPYNYYWNTGCTDIACNVTAAGTISITVTDANECSGFDTVTVSVEICQTLPETEPETVLAVYPNPSDGTFFIKMQPASQFPVQFEIIDILGTAVWKGEIRNRQTGVVMCDITAGAYTLRVFTGDVVTTRLLIIK
ncbi:MAG: T9SS type A sorting domain-containing protein [Bacteroidetes bacterium]|nr:T9SS type A sorting domain-containing protein [Bacteroidota bacterium]